ncbi:hypothetical protein S40288_06016 [Stachybotrys chartarum IBT 40288]|nr:hypothetical protein S40288_06016 [Stachybotrys chartarum IBT 40288]
MPPTSLLPTTALRSFISNTPRHVLRTPPIHLIRQPSRTKSLCTSPPRCGLIHDLSPPPPFEDTEMESKEGKPQKKGAITLKTPKGTRDWIGADINLRDDIFAKVSKVFKCHGGTPLDTPVFELNEILTNKYGEDSKLIYELQDQGGELCSLRYDLTVPLARYLAQSSTLNMKRYQIAKVYRRDNPSIARGRLREFFQCDFDTVGEYDTMIPDSEILCIAVEVFESLGLGADITIKLNHRKILDGLFTVAGVPDDKIRPISSAVDKLDKAPWAEVKKEMVEEKGLTEDVADKIGEYVKHSGGAELIEFLKKDEAAMSNEKVKAGLEEMDMLFQYLAAYDITNKVSFDLSLARGLDYYTGLIYEVVTKLPPDAGKRDEESRIGSIAAGGRYDNLVGMFGKRQIPCVGISFGVDRIFTILKTRQDKEKQATRKTDVYVMAFGGKTFDGLLPARMEVARLLWKAGIRAEFSAKVKPKLPQQFKAAESNDVPLAVILGEGEVAEGKLRLKVLGLKDATGEDKDGRLLGKEELVAEINLSRATEDRSTIMDNSLDDTSLSTLSLLESRVRRIEHILYGQAAAPSLARDASAVNKIGGLEKRFSLLLSNIRVYSELLKIYKANSDIFHSPHPSEPPSQLSPEAIQSIVLASASSYPATLSALTAIKDSPVPDLSESTSLIALSQRMRAVEATQLAQAAEMAELRRRSEAVVRSWYEGGVLRTSQVLADVEGRMERVERRVRRAEHAREEEQDI